MDSGLQGKTALITGASEGLGRAIALALASEGVHVALANRKPSPVTVKQIEAHGVRALPLAVDISQEDQVVHMIEQVISHFGNLDLYVNNAAGAWHEPVTRLTTEAFRKTIDTNLAACLWACREVSKHMIGRGQGSILIVGSTAQFNRGIAETSYHISKAGLRIYMTQLAVELAPYGIRVNLLVPGHYPTHLTASLSDERATMLKGKIPLRRFGRPEELGPAAVLLLSDRLSSYTTGAELVVDGGLHLRPIQLISDAELAALNRP